MEQIKEFTMYKGKPLVRNGNVLCYGDPSEKAILVLTVLTTKKYMDKEIADMIFLQVLETGENGAILKQAEKNGLYAALDIGAAWLDRELKK